MAFQVAPMGLHQIASTTSEMWPAISDALRAPLRKAGAGGVMTAERKAAPARREQPARIPSPQRAEMPEYMTSVPLGALRPQAPSSALAGPLSTQSMLSAMPRGTLRYASPLTRSFSLRAYSTTTRLGPFSLRAPPKTNFVGFNQQRTLFGSSWGSQTNQNYLAHLEQTANNNPGSATAQNAFYQALLRANMPEILVERYQTGRYATNGATDGAYSKALERLGAAEVSSGGYGTMAGRTPGGQGQGLSNETLQSIGQAVASKVNGGTLGRTSSNVTGAKNDALYVVVEESWNQKVFRWVKFVVVYGFFGYCVLVLITMGIEATGAVRKTLGGQSAEAKPELQTTKFSDVQGCDEAKEELQELVEFLKAPESFSTLGGKLPKGVLLVGPPGTGKTLLARAVAGEAGVPFFYMSGSEFDEIYVGVGAKRVRELFSNARAKSPAIIFIDELDAIGSKRHERDAAYAKQTLNQLLTELDGFDQTSGVIIIGATNFPQSLDKALTRPGRFDRNVNVPLPDVRGRIAILKHHLKNIRVDASVDPAILARGCPGFSGAELENVVNQAAVRASKNKATKVTLDDLVWAKDKVMMGAERRSAVIQDKDKLMTAYHEGGHALVAMLTKESTPLYKATIMPRGQALGITWQLPELDKVSETKKELMARIDVSMGGKVAEELIYGPDNVTTGASSDIQSATAVAYHMVTRAGMSDVLGNIDLASDYQKLSPITKQQIENEVRRLVEEGRDRAMKLLTTNREGLERLAKALVEYETLDKEEMEKVVRGEKLTGKLKVDVSTPIKAPEPNNPLGPLPTPVGNEGSLGAPPGPVGGDVAGRP